MSGGMRSTLGWPRLNLDRAIEKATTVTDRDMRAPHDGDDPWPLILGPAPIWGAVCWPAAAVLAVLHLAGVIPWTAAEVVALAPFFPVAFMVYLLGIMNLFGVAIPWAWRTAARPIRRRRRLRRARHKYAAGHHTLAALEQAVERAYRGER